MYPKTFNIQVTIDGTVYQAEQVATTLTDAEGGIVDRWSLFQNGEYVGRLCQWSDGEYTEVIDGVGTTRNSSEIQITSI